MITGHASASHQIGDTNWRGQADIDGFATFTDRDVSYEEESSSGGGEDNLQTYFGATAQANYIDPDGVYSIGVLGHVGSVNGGDDEQRDHRRWWPVRGHGVVNSSLSTVKPACSGRTMKTEFDVMTDAWFVRGGVNYYHDENMRFRGEVSYAAGEENDSASAPTSTRCRGSFAPTMRPTTDRSVGSANIAARKSKTTACTKKSPTTRSCSVSASRSAKPGSIQEYDALAPHNAPDVARWTGYSHRSRRRLGRL